MTLVDCTVPGQSTFERTVYGLQDKARVLRMTLVYCAWCLCTVSRKRHKQLSTRDHSTMTRGIRTTVQGGTYLLRSPGPPEVVEDAVAVRRGVQQQQVQEQQLHTSAPGAEHGLTQASLRASLQKETSKQGLPFRMETSKQGLRRPLRQAQEPASVP